MSALVQLQTSLPQPAVQDPFDMLFLVFQGDDLSLDLTIWSTAPASDGTGGIPQDISGWWFLSTVKSDYDDPDAEAIRAYDWQIAAGAGTSGQTTAPLLPGSVNVALNPRQYPWDIKVIIPPATSPETLLAGRINVLASVTLRLTHQ